MTGAASYTRSMSVSIPHPSALDPVPRHRPRYRWRTWMRGHVPWALVVLFPKGLKDCGQHEWRRRDEETDGCYHCMVGVRPHQPIDVPIDDEFRMGLVRWAEESGSAFAAEMVEKFHAHDRELGRPRWEPPADLVAPRSARERLFARISSLGDAARRSARRIRSS
jgi:hypothetical protein